MAYCSKCGQEMQMGARFCTACGADSENGNSSGAGKNGKSVFEEFLQTGDYTNSFSREDIEQNKVYAVLAYLGFLVLIPLLAARKSPFAKFHTEQGFLLFIISLTKEFVFRILYKILQVAAPYFLYDTVRVCLSIVNGAIGIALLVMIIFGVVNAVKGQAKELPLIGKWRMFQL